MLEKIKNLQWYYQLLLLVVIASVIYGVGVYYFFTSVTRAEVAATNAEVEKLEVQNNAARVATQRINEFRALYATKMVEYEELKVLLPEQREITNVLQGLQDNARDSRMIVMRFSPRDDTQQDVIMAKPVEIEVDSNFNNLRAFFDKMAKLPRIVSVSDFKLNQLEKQTAEKTVHAQFLLTAYYADPEMMNKPAPAAKGGKKGKAAKDKAGAEAAPADAAKPAAK